MIKLNLSKCCLQIQCDQIAKLIFNMIPFATFQICPKASNFCQIKLKVLPKINPYKIAKYFKHFAKVVKFRHIWSHRLQLTAGIDFY